MNNNYSDCLAIEASSYPELAAWLAMQSDGGRFVFADYGKGLLYEIQKELGDACASVQGRMTWFEFKSEMKATGNLFLESWSDCPKVPGWLVTCRADYLVCHFRTPPTIYCMHLPTLQAWAYLKRRIYDYPEKNQQKHGGPNLTRGYVVPVEDLRREVPLTEWPGWVVGGEVRWRKPICSAVIGRGGS